MRAGALSAADALRIIVRAAATLQLPPIGGFVDKLEVTELEAAAFRRLVQHLRERVEVQNIDLMNLAGFCRNCLAKWYRAAAEERGIAMDYEQAREIIYGMPYAEWKEKHQHEATQQQRAEYEQRHG
jgi:hypothetical protein